METATHFIITLKTLEHKKLKRIAIIAPNSKLFNKEIKKLSDCHWSRTHNCWHIAYTKRAAQHAIEVLSKLGKVDVEQLKQHQQIKQGLALNTETITNISKAKIITTVAVTSKLSTPLKINPFDALCAANMNAYHEFINLLKAKAYSQSTFKTYRNEFLIFLKKLKDIPAERLEVEHIKRYIIHCLENEKLSENTVHSRLNALKFYYEQVLGKEKMFFEMPRPKKPLQLPKVLGESEVGKLFNAIQNIKHKAILFTAYSAGLRVSEVVKLRVQDIDSSRMQIFVEKAKGKKDRYVMLSSLLLDILRGYIKSLNCAPTYYLFEGQNKHEHYSCRSAQDIFKVAKDKAGITKKMSFHSLRHSFATHLLDKGVDIKYIKDLLGHFNIKTTERYLHIRKDKLMSISSPLDDLWVKGEIKW
jgi:integrase/recombinase XerD